MKRTATIVLALAVAACVGDSVTHAPTPPTPSTLAPPSGPARYVVGPTSTIKPTTSTGLCIDVTGGTFVNGTPLIIYTCNGTVAQGWSPTSDGEYRTTYGLSYCIDTQNASSVNGTKVLLWNCYGSPSQKWTWTAAKELKGIGGKCIQPTGNKVKSNVALEIAACNGSAKQKWNAPPIPADTVTPPPPTYTVTVGAGAASTGSGTVTGTGIACTMTGTTATGDCSEQLAQGAQVTVTATATNGGSFTGWGGACSGTAPCTVTATQAQTVLASFAAAQPSDTNTYLNVLPTQSIQAAVDANPAGAKFKLLAGTFVRQTVTPKTNNLFRLEPGAVLDGENVTQFAFRGRTGAGVWINGVKIVGGKITRYASPSQNGAIWAGNDALNSTDRWVVDSVEVSYSANLAIRVGNHMQVLRSNLHHSGTINIGGNGVGMIVDGVESAYGNDGCPNDPGFESGGSKFAATDSLIVRNSWFHHNCGVGLWLDINNRWWLLENNRTEDNYREGIAIEISCGGIVRNNIVNRNGWPNDPFRTNNWGWDAGIGIHASPDVEVYGNTLDENYNGIIGLQQNRGSGPYCPYIVQNLYVHDNVVFQRRTALPGVDGSFSGAVQDVNDTAIFTSRNNRWVHNTYYVGTANTRPFGWMNLRKTPQEWQAAGQDVTGVFNP